MLTVVAVIGWSAVTGVYGMQDDYSQLRRTVYEPGYLLTANVALARPLNGWLNEWALGEAGSVERLRWVRLGGMIGVAFAGCALYHWLRWLQVGGRLLCSAWAIFLLSLPGFQVLQSWAVCWGYSWAFVAALEGSRLVLAREDFRRWDLKFTFGCLLLLTCALIYQTYVFIFLGLLGVTTLKLLSAEASNVRPVAIKFVQSLMVFAMIGLIAYGIAAAIARATATELSSRTAFVLPDLSAVWWYLREVLAVHLSPWFLRGSFGENAWKAAGSGLFVCFAILAFVSSTGLLSAWRWRGVGCAIGVGLCLTAPVGLLWIIQEKYGSYRALLPFAVSTWCMVAWMLSQFSRRWFSKGKWLGTCLVIICAVISVFAAEWRLRSLVVEPQQKELMQVRSRIAELMRGEPCSAIHVVPAPNMVGWAPLVATNEFGLPSMHQDFSFDGLWELEFRKRGRSVPPYIWNAVPEANSDPCTLDFSAMIQSSPSSRFHGVE